MRRTIGIVIMTCLHLLSACILMAPALCAQDDITPEQLNVFEPGQGQEMLWAWMHAQAGKLPHGEFPPGTKQDWDIQKPGVQQSVQELLGIDGLEKTPLNGEVLGTIDRPGFTVTKLRWQGRPGFYTLANLWKPKHAPGKLPAILWIPGHSDTGKAAYGWPQNIFVRKGFIVLAIDWVGYSERTPQNHDKNAVCWTVGTSVAGLEIWDDIRAMDYLLSRDDVDPARVGIAGRSGGGTQTMWLIGAEPRAAAYVPQAGLSTFQEAYVQRAGGHCLCNYTPGPLARLNIAHILATGAPDKYIHVVNGTMDTLFPITGAKESVSLARQVYDLYGRKDRLQLFTDMGEHPATDKQIRRITQFFMKTLTPENTDYSIPEFEHLTPEELTVGLPADSKTSIDICREMRDALPELRVPETPEEWLGKAEELRTRLRDEILGGFPERGPLNVQMNESIGNDDVVIERVSIETEPGLRIPMDIYHPVLENGKWQVGIALTRFGKNQHLFELDSDQEDSENSIVDEYSAIARGMNIMLVVPDLRGLGEMSSEPDGQLKFMRNYLEYELTTSAGLTGRPLAGMRAYDISRIIDYLMERDDVDPLRISVAALPDMAHIALLASALDTRIAALTSNVASENVGVTLMRLPTTFFIEELPETMSMDFYIPNILDVGDIPIISALIAPRGLEIAGIRDASMTVVDGEESMAPFEFTQKIYELLGASDNLAFTSDTLP